MESVALWARAPGGGAGYEPLNALPAPAAAVVTTVAEEAAVKAEAAVEAEAEAAVEAAVDVAVIAAVDEETAPRPAGEAKAAEEATGAELAP